MAHIAWTDELNTGISVIDKQHLRIVEYINNLDDIKESHDRDEIENILGELVDYTLSHFAFEESLMEEAKYSFITGHKRVHQLFVKRVGSFQQRFKMGEDITEELLAMLKAWLLNHIRCDDNDYVTTVRANMENINSTKGEGWLVRSVKKFFG